MEFSYRAQANLDEHDIDAHKPIVRLFIPPSFEGVMGATVLQEIINEDVELEVRYVNTLDFRDFEPFKGALTNLVLGLPYRGYNLSEGFFDALDSPFTEFIHISTYGEEIAGEHIQSFVEENQDPIKILFDMLEKNPESLLLHKHVTVTDKARHLVNATNAYRTWTHGDSTIVKVLLSLYRVGYKSLPKLIQNLELSEIIRHYADIIKAQIEKEQEYIQKKIQSVKSAEVNIDGSVCNLHVVYAEDYINELANYMLSSLGDASKPTIACVCRTTRGGDLISIRTDKIHAGDVAHIINEGNGKDNVASVFINTGFAEIMVQSIATKISIFGKQE